MVPARTRIGVYALLLNSGLLTLIHQQEGGLQVLQDNVWQDIPPIPNTLVVNGGSHLQLTLTHSGDFLSILTNGRFVSPIHRVLQPPIKSRISFVFFFYPDYDVAMPEGDDSLRSRLSLFANQNSNCDNERKQRRDGCHQCFGDLICEKWKQVAR